MKILVIDVAAEHGGALSILNQFIEKFKKDTDNEYIVCVSNLNFEDSGNIKYVRLPWVKRSKLHRMYFDSVYVRKLVKKYMPDKIFSLQNKAFKIRKIPQDVYFHNALFICEKRFRFKESGKLWVYQNIISKMTKKSMKYADTILVQAEWIKKELSCKWKIDASKIKVDRPEVDPIFIEPVETQETTAAKLFFPANFGMYKNHRTLLRACVELWEEEGLDSFSLILTGKEDDFPKPLKSIASGKSYPIFFVGSLSHKEMKDLYMESVLVFPSYIETVGLPLMEARALGRPIIAADCEYARESVARYDKVTFFNPFDVCKLKKEISYATKKR